MLQQHVETAMNAWLAQGKTESADRALMQTVQKDILLRLRCRAQRLEAEIVLGAYDSTEAFLLASERGMLEAYQLEQQIKAAPEQLSDINEVRIVRNAKRAWISAFQRLARLIGMPGKTLELKADGRKGEYRASIVDKIDDRLARYTRLGQDLGIAEEHSLALHERCTQQEADAAVDLSTPEADWDDAALELALPVLPGIDAVDCILQNTVADVAPSEVVATSATINQVEARAVGMPESTGLAAKAVSGALNPPRNPASANVGPTDADPILSASANIVGDGKPVATEPIPVRAQDFGPSVGLKPPISSTLSGLM